MAEREYFIVNPKGTIHIVTREHAQMRLASPGWRMANAKEITAYRDGVAGASYRDISKENEDPKFMGKQFIQRTGEPLAEPFRIDPDAAMERADEELRKVEAQYDSPEGDEEEEKQAIPQATINALTGK
ncbi:MAG: hypothetical protein KAJ19_09955 [Gammaproteobacteria bacterium]|nr:hypothetical protein [Gammaproteobacteria bacterium]